jgi:hypothetical protein
MSNKIEMGKFVKAAKKAMKDCNLEGLMSEACSRSRKDGIWYKIAQEYHGDLFDKDSEFVYQKAYACFCFWKRNSRMVNQLIKDSSNSSKNSPPNSSTNEKELNFDLNFYARSDLKNIVLDLEPSDWNEFSNLISVSSNKKRMWLRRGFGNFLSHKLQQKAGFNCWLQNKQNHFNLRQNKTKPHWRGIFKCIEEGCRNVFKAKIEKVWHPYTKSSIEISFRGDECSHKRVSRCDRITGSLRKRMALEVIANGARSVSAEHIFQNYKKNSKPG